MARTRSTAAAGRRATVTRKTRETEIHLTLALDGTGRSAVATGIPFMDHMLELFSRHGLFDLDVTAKGDLEVDAHHTMEDLGLVLGQALREAVGDKAGIRRYGWCALPMDEALALVSLDLSGRPCLVYAVPAPAVRVKDIDTRLFQEFFQALVNQAGMTLHLRLLSGEEVHHVIEAIFKGFAKALDQAVAAEPRTQGKIPSTKGIL
jgi:imidazoleglycerol-phosphate dehydratase